jgi:predicted DNA binding protein
VISECLVVEFRVTGDGCPLAEASRAAEATVEAAPPLRRGDGYTLLRFSSPDPELAEVLEADDRIRYLHRAETGGEYTYRCLSKERCVVHRLIDEGFLVESVGYREGTERHVGAVVGQDVLSGVLEAAGETVGVRLERISPLREEGEGGVDARWDLTPAQTEALEAAYGMGYFEVPKAVTAADVAAELGVSKSAFLERLRRGQATLLRQVLD